MVDPARGVLMVDGFEVGPATTAAELARALGTGDALHGKAIADRRYLVRARFDREQLVALTLVDEDPTFGTGWDDFSEREERARHAAHDAALAATLGPAHRSDRAHHRTEWSLPWGTVSSILDPRGGGAEIQIRYHAGR